MNNIQQTLMGDFYKQLQDMSNLQLPGSTTTTTVTVNGREVGKWTKTH